jgi:hypothetical protein
MASYRQQQTRDRYSNLGGGGGSSVFPCHRPRMETQQKRNGEKERNRERGGGLEIEREEEGRERRGERNTVEKRRSKREQ